MLFLFMLLREKDQKVLYSFEMLLLSEKLLQKYRPAALMIQIVNIGKSKDALVFLRVGFSNFLAFFAKQINKTHEITSF